MIMNILGVIILFLLLALLFETTDNSKYNFRSNPEADFEFTRVDCILIVLLDFSLTVKAATLIFISGCGSAISSAKEGKSGYTYNLVKSK